MKEVQELNRNLLSNINLVTKDSVSRVILFHLGDASAP